MGLLDQFSSLNEDQTQGLLAAAAQMLQQSGPSRTPTSFGQIAGGGMMAYQGAMTEAKKRKQEEEQQRQMAQYRGLQIQEAQGGLQDHAQKRARALEMDALQKEFALRGQTQASPPQAGAQPMPAMPGAAPQPAAQPQKPQGQYEQAMAYAQFLQSKGMVQQALAVAKEAQVLKPKYSTTPQVMRDNDGSLRNLQLAEDGSPPLELAYGVKPDMVATSLGGTTRWDDKNALTPGQQFQRTQTPESLASNAVSMRGQNMTDSRARDFNSVQADANNLKREEKKAVTDMTKAGQVASFDTMLGTLDRLSQHPGLSRSVGLVGKLPTMPGSDSANFQAELDTFQSQAFIPMVSQLKGMGALSDAEGKKLTAAVGALSPNMGETAFRQSVQRITDEMDQARARVSGKVARSGAQPARKSVMRGQVIDGYRFKGGDPADQNNWELK